jgi:hypothetical protein
MKGKLVIGIVALAVVAALLAAHGSSVRAQPVASIALPAPRDATVDLYAGCNNIALSFPDGTACESVVDAVTPAGVVGAMWRHNAALNKWEGFSPVAPAASDLKTVNAWDAVWLCVAGAAGPAPTATAPPPPPPAPTATATAVTPIVFESGDGKDRSFHLDTSKFRMDWTVDIKGLHVPGAATTEGSFEAHLVWSDAPGMPGFELLCFVGPVHGLGVKSGTKECTGGPGEFTLKVLAFLVNSWRVTITPLAE